MGQFPGLPKMKLPKKVTLSKLTTKGLQEKTKGLQAKLVGMMKMNKFKKPKGIA